MNKLISANYWFGCDWWFYEVGYLGMRAGQLSLGCAGVYLWNTGHLRVTDPRLNSGFQHTPAAQVGMRQVSWVVQWGWWVEIDKAHATMVNGRMQFCKIVSFVKLTWGPGDEELLLLGPILDPVEAHIHGAGLVGLDGVPG